MAVPNKLATWRALAIRWRALRAVIIGGISLNFVGNDAHRAFWSMSGVGLGRSRIMLTDEKYRRRCYFQAVHHHGPEAIMNDVLRSGLFMQR